MSAQSDRVSKAERFLEKLYENTPPPTTISREDNERISCVLRELCTPSKPATCKPRDKSKVSEKSPLRLSSVVASLGYPPMDRGTLVLIAGRLEQIFKRVRGKHYVKPVKSKCFCLGLGAERVYTEADRLLMCSAVVDVLGPIGE